MPHTELLDFGRLAELLGYDRKTNTLDFPGNPAGLPRAVERAASAPPGGAEGGQPLRRPRGAPGGLGRRSEGGRGVGEARAKEIREGLRRLQEVDIVDRYP